jgi:uncharacterized protein YyaL (SSP411 family)
LLQHVDNPVDWYPWGDDAFERARTEDRPIFLSVGYSTCHWCHVMAHESFESPEIAAVLNEHFVPIKVDREERPDVDRVYMAFVQATTGSGGWPMSVWLTPGLKPFYGGTYFPPTSRWGRPGFTEVLNEIARAWREERPKVDASAEAIFARLHETSGSGGGASPAPPERRVGDARSLTDAVADYERSFDRRNGGFGRAPKFPRPSELMFLLREYARTGRVGARDVTLATLRAMALGGMRDHVGGGFHRYSVDAEWRVPHFEKMLYDQAQLVLAYLEAAQITGEPFYGAVAHDTLEYVRRDLRDPAGGFQSAEDADSVPPEHAGDAGAHKTEGAFYIWSDNEIRDLLGEDADVVRFRFGVEPGGNAPQDPQGEFTRKNLLYTAREVDDVAQRTGRTADEVADALFRARHVLFEARNRRPRPHLDDKILTAWNGLMIAAFARASRAALQVTDDDRATRARHLDTARRAAAFVRHTLWRSDTAVLLRRYRDRDASIGGYCEDYACLVWGLLELFQADPDPAWLEWALRLQERQDQLFWDPIEGGWFGTTGLDPSVLLRMKEDYDGAEPSAASVSALNLLTLAHLTGEARFFERVEQTLARLGPEPGRLGRVVPLMLAALSTYHAGVTQIVILGPRGRDDTDGLLRVVGRRYLPFSIVVQVEPGAHQTALSTLLPFVGPMNMIDGHATAHVCRDFTCKAPVSDPEALEAALSG